MPGEPKPKTPDQIAFETKMREEMERDMKKEIKFGKAEYTQPGGELYKEERPDRLNNILFGKKLTEDEMRAEMSRLKVAKEAVVNFLENSLILKKPIGGLKITENTNLSELKSLEGKLSSHVEIAVDVLLEGGIDGGTPLRSLLAEVNERIDQNSRILRNK